MSSLVIVLEVLSLQKSLSKILILGCVQICYIAAVYVHTIIEARRFLGALWARREVKGKVDLLDLEGNLI